jgi:hypothetical protein
MACLGRRLRFKQRTGTTAAPHRSALLQHNSTHSAQPNSYGTPYFAPHASTDLLQVLDPTEQLHVEMLGRHHSAFPAEIFASPEVITTAATVAAAAAAARVHTHTPPDSVDDHPAPVWPAAGCVIHSVPQTTIFSTRFAFQIYCRPSVTRLTGGLYHARSRSHSPNITAGLLPYS